MSAERKCAAFTAGIVSLMMCVNAAGAASLTNHDERDYKVTIIEGSESADRTLKPSEILSSICSKGCVIRLNDSEEDEYQLEPDDVVSIEDGSLYYDDPATGPAPAPAPPPAAGAQPSPPPASPPASPPAGK